MAQIISLRKFTAHQTTPQRLDLIAKIEVLSTQIRHLEARLQPDCPSSHPRRLAVALQGQIRFIPMDMIVHCRAESNYTKLMLCDGSILCISQTLKSIAGRLPGDQFVRVHAGHLVRKNCIESYRKRGGVSVVLENGKRIPVSRSYKSSLEHALLQGSL